MQDDTLVGSVKKPGFLTFFPKTLLFVFAVGELFLVTIVSITSGTDFMTGANLGGSPFALWIIYYFLIVCLPGLFMARARSKRWPKPEPRRYPRFVTVLFALTLGFIALATILVLCLLYVRSQN